LIELVLYRPFKYEFSFCEDILLRGTKIVVPTVLRNKVLQLGHETHPGMETMKRLLRSRVWWPKIDHVNELVKKCHSCAIATPEFHPEPIKRRDLSTVPWADIAIDFCGPLPSGHYLLHNRKLNETFLIMPKTITADNGRQFISREFRAFCNENSIKLYSTPPYWPQANGLVERQNRSILKVLKISANTPGSDWRHDLQKYLLTDRNTPHPSTGLSPAEMLFGRPTRMKIPSIIEIGHSEINGEARDRDQIYKMKGKEYADKSRNAKQSKIEIGDLVLVRREGQHNKLSTFYETELYCVLEKSHGDVLLKSSSGKIIRRNIAHLKKRPAENNIDIDRNLQEFDSQHQQDQNSSLDSSLSPNQQPTDSHKLPQIDDNQSEPPERLPIPKLRIKLFLTPTCTPVEQQSREKDRDCST
jgi:hypothetical protein